MIIYTRILDDNTFGGNFLEHQLQEGWNYTVLQPSEDLISPLWDGSQWIEGATEEEIYQAKLPQINSIMSLYDSEIEKLCLRHIIRQQIKAIPIPTDIETEYDRLVALCNVEIKQILPSATYSRPSGQTTKQK